MLPALAAAPLLQVGTGVECDDVDVALEYVPFVAYVGTGATTTTDEVIEAELVQLTYVAIEEDISIAEEDISMDEEAIEVTAAAVDVVAAAEDISVVMAAEDVAAADDDAPGTVTPTDEHKL